MRARTARVYVITAARLVLYGSRALAPGNMHLYALTLQKASCIYQAVHGNFSGTKQQEILIGRGKTLELLRPDPNTGKLHSVVSTEVFGLIRSISPFRLTGSTKGKERTSSYSI